MVVVAHSTERSKSRVVVTARAMRVVVNPRLLSLAWSLQPTCISRSGGRETASTWLLREEQGREEGESIGEREGREGKPRGREVGEGGETARERCRGGVASEGESGADRV